VWHVINILLAINLTDAVIEAGGEVDNNPNVTEIENFIKAIGTPIDWQHPFAHQTYANWQRISFPSGKALAKTIFSPPSKCVFSVPKMKEHAEQGGVPVGRFACSQTCANIIGYN
jgi:hypothetical protein